DNPCTPSYYISDRFPERNLAASNLGLIAKSADNLNYTVAVTDLITTIPVSGARVDFYNLQQQLLGTGFTGSDGFAKISLDQIPYLLLAEHSGQQSWLRLDDGSSLSMSNFDVSGEKIQSGIKGMIYGERGVWRPGDTLFLTFLMDDSQHQLPEAHPVVLEVFNARNQQVSRQVKTSGIEGFYTFKVITEPEAPTGNWRARVTVGGATFDKTLKIETIKPNRLKIDLTFNRKILSKNYEGQKGFLISQWLHGAKASGLRAQVNLKLINKNYTFEGFEKYSFSDPTKNFWPVEEELYNSVLDANGEAQFNIRLNVNNNAPGMLTAVFNTRVFEKGGDFSTDVFSAPFAPYNNFVGLYVPDGGGYRKMLETDTNHIVKVVSVDKNGKPVSLDGLEARIYKISWRWWWSSRDDNMASWTRGENSELIMKKVFSTKEGKADLRFKIDYPDWGRFFIQILDPSGKHSAGMPVYIDWPYYRNRSDRSNPAGASMLSFSSDKEKYNPGDIATLNIPTSEGSRALVTIESANQTLKNWWVDCNKGETQVSFEVTGEMAPNVYAWVTMLQPHAQTANDMPLRMFGVIPIMVEDPVSILEPQIIIPEEIRPKTDYQIKISEKNGRAMTYTIAVVDEGLLSITRFKTPDPWSRFFAREALGIKTWDLFDEVLGAYGGRLQKVLAIGGDEESGDQKDKKANRFKPVVTFLGPFSLEKGQRATHEIYMENYVGSVRAMVIAGNDGAWGAAEANAFVRQPVMILPTAPRVIGSGESFDLPVSVFVMSDKIKDVDVNLSVDGGLEISGENRQTLSFTEPGDQMVFFRIKAKEMVGIGEILVTATSGGEVSTAKVELNVRNPNPVISQTESYILKEGEEKTIPVSFFGMTGTNNGVIEVSGLPPFNLEKHLGSLIRYPYGCVEQVTSSVFPQLYLDVLVDLDDSKLVQINRNIRAAIKKLTRYQRYDGSLSYWPGGNYISDWGSIYAGHFFLLAEQKGYLVPYQFKTDWIDWQYKAASDFDRSQEYNKRYYNFTQAYRLYTLALAGQPNMGAMNRLREYHNLDPSSRWRLAAAYQLAGKPEAARELTKNEDYTFIDVYDRPGPTFGSSLRDMAMILETLVLMDRKDEAFQLLQKMTKMMETSYLSTQTAAFSLYAIARFAGNFQTDNKLEFTYNTSGKDETVRAWSSIYQIQLEPSVQTGQQVRLHNDGTGVLFITKTLTGQPLSGMEESQSKNLNLNIKYMDLSGNSINVSNLAQGTDFSAMVTITNPGNLGIYDNMALSQVFPSGWEIINMRLNDQEPVKKESQYTYRDIRDDRVYTFFDLNPNKSHTYHVLLHASYGGRFYLPAVSCEAMYDNAIYSHIKGQWVEVLREK
nr:hypothetical protein [Bacteroidota bacterium]